MTNYAILFSGTLTRTQVLRRAMTRSVCLQEMHVFIRKLLPALPTVFLSLLLAPDFDGIVYRLYLGFLLFYWGFILLAAIGFFVFLGLRRDFRASAVVAWMILLISSISLMPLNGPVEEFLRNHSHANRVHAVGTRVFEPGNRFQYTMTAQGRGGWNAFELQSGFTNIMIDGNHTKGPSLHYSLKPDVHLLENRGDPCAAPARLDPVDAFDQSRLPGIMSVKDFHEFMTVMEAFASIQSKADFDRKFHNPAGEKAARIGLQPDEKLVYQICFLLIGMGAIVTSLLLTAVPEKTLSSPDISAGGGHTE